MILFNSLTFFKGELWATKGAQELGRAMVVDPETLEISRTVTFELGSFLENSTLSVYNKQFRLFSDGKELFSILLDVKTLPNPEYQSQVLEEDKKRRKEEEEKTKKRLKLIEEAKKDKGKGKGRKSADKPKEPKKKNVNKEKEKKSNKNDEPKNKAKSNSRSKKIIKKVRGGEKRRSKEMTEIMIQAKKEILEFEKSSIFGEKAPEIENPSRVTPLPPKDLHKSFLANLGNIYRASRSPQSITDAVIPQLESAFMNKNVPPEPPKPPLTSTTKVYPFNTRFPISTSKGFSKPGDVDPKLNDWFLKNLPYEKWLPPDKSKRANRPQKEESMKDELLRRDPRVLELMRDSVNQELFDELAIMDMIRKKDSQMNSNDRPYADFGFRGNVESIEGFKGSKIEFYLRIWVDFN